MKTIKLFCKEHGITIDQFYGKYKISDLYLSSLTSIPEGFNPTVGGSLYLRSLTSIPEGFNPKDFIKSVNLMSWQDGKYIKCDGVFTEVMSKKGKVYIVRKIGSKDVAYLVTDGNGRYSHGKTIKEAKADLIYKITDRDKSNYKDMALDTVLLLSEAIECYRVITGACSFGVKGFVESLPKVKKSYTISEIIDITRNSYGHNTFVNFFTVEAEK